MNEGKYFLIIKLKDYSVYDFHFLIGEGTTEDMQADMEKIKLQMQARAFWNKIAPNASDEVWDALNDWFGPLLNDEIDLKTAGDEIPIEDIEWFGIFYGAIIQKGEAYASEQTE